MTAIVTLDKIKINDAGGDGWLDDGDTEWKLNFRVDSENPPKVWSDNSVHDPSVHNSSTYWLTDDANGKDYQWVVDASPGQGISLEAWGEEDDPVFDDDLPSVSEDYHGGNVDDYTTTASDGEFSYTLFWDFLFI